MFIYVFPTQENCFHASSCCVPFQRLHVGMEARPHNVMLRRKKNNVKHDDDGWGSLTTTNDRGLTWRPFVISHASCASSMFPFLPWFCPHFTFTLSVLSLSLRFYQRSSGAGHKFNFSLCSIYHLSGDVCHISPRLTSCILYGCVVCWQNTEMRETETVSEAAEGMEVNENFFFKLLKVIHVSWNPSGRLELMLRKIEFSNVSQIRLRTIFQ